MVSIIAIDVETTPMGDKREQLLSVAWSSTTEGSGVTEWDVSACMQIQTLIDIHDQVVFHHAAYDLAYLINNGVFIPQGKVQDTQALFYCLFPGQRSSLSALSRQFLSKDKLESPSFDRVTDELLEYNLQDARLTLELWETRVEEAEEWEGVMDFYYDVERPYIFIILEMEMNGCFINKQALEEEKELQRQIVYEAECELHQLAGVLEDRKNKLNSSPLMSRKATRKFNPNAVADIIAVLQKQGVKIPGTTKTGKPKVDAAFLEKTDTPFTKALLKYRKSSKFLTTFLEGIENKLDIRGRIHTSFRQFDVNTGRLSSANPNLQNIPSRDERGAKIRRMFVAPEGRMLYVGDLDRIELVVLGFYLELYLGYSTLSDRIKTGEDVHQSNAHDWSQIVGHELSRKPCKNGIFALVYGCGVRTFAQTIGCTLEQAQEIFKRAELIVEVNRLREIFIQLAREADGVITNWMGRQLYVPNVVSRDFVLRSRGERQVFNYMVQSTAGDVFKTFQIDSKEKRLHSPLFDLDPTLTQLLVVHDEAVLEGIVQPSKEEYQKICNGLSSLYSSTDVLNDNEGVFAKVSCEFHWGNNWYDTKGD